MESIKVVFAILMIQNGSTIEMVPTEGLSDCLKPVSYTHLTLPTIYSV